MKLVIEQFGFGKRPYRTVYFRYGENNGVFLFTLGVFDFSDKNCIYNFYTSVFYRHGCSGNIF